MISLLFYSAFFLFSSTKIGHVRPSVKDRYAISDKNILRSCVVRYFYLKFLACRSSMPCEMYKKKGKKWGGRCVEAVLFHFSTLTILPLSNIWYKRHSYAIELAHWWAYFKYWCNLYLPGFLIILLLILFFITKSVLRQFLKIFQRLASF